MTSRFRIKPSLEAVKTDLIAMFGYPEMTVEDFYDNVRNITVTHYPTVVMCLKMS